MTIRLNEGELHELVAAARAESDRIGMPTETLLTIMAYETGGTLDPWQKGPTTKWGVHRGLIQMGEPQRREYGYTQDSSISDKVKASADYLVDRGWRPGMNEVDAYSIVNAGAPGLEHRTDEKNGGAPGTVAEKVASRDWRLYAQRMSGLLEKVGPSRSLSEFARETEDRLGYENLRSGPVFRDIGSSLPEKFETLNEIPFELSGIVDTRMDRMVPRPKPNHSGMPGSPETGRSIEDAHVPLVTPDFAAKRQMLDPRRLDASDIPFPVPKPVRDRGQMEGNPFDLNTQNLKRQAELLDRNPIHAKRLILAAGRDPEGFGFA